MAPPQALALAKVYHGGHSQHVRAVMSGCKQFGVPIGPASTDFEFGTQSLSNARVVVGT
jgi:hypothetical protein